MGRLGPSGGPACRNLAGEISGFALPVASNGQDPALCYAAAWGEASISSTPASPRPAAESRRSRGRMIGTRDEKVTARS